MMAAPIKPAVIKAFVASAAVVVAAALARSIEEDLFGAVLPNFARALYLGGAEIAE